MSGSPIIRKIAVCLLTLAPALLAAELSPAKLLAAGRVDDAILTLETRINAVPSDAASQNLLCRAYLALTNWDASIAACQKAVVLEPGNSQYHLWLGRAYGEKADHSSFVSATLLAKKVRSEFETSVRLDPSNVEAHADLAQFYVQAPGIIGGGTDKAAIQAQQLASLDPAQAHSVRGQIAEKDKDQAAAEREFRAAIQASGGKPGMWMNLAQFYRRSNRLDEMQVAIQQATLAQKNQHVLLAAAEVLIRTQRDLPAAGELLRRYLAGETVEEAPAFKAHYWLGNLLEQQGDTRAAAQEYRNALSLARDFSLAQDALKRLDRLVEVASPH
ncbi:MAG: tetratricopeptide repeat protein [Terriglobales bacterium]|jgi:cytochrome c-type biogenesis protein CcmH/NrfG